MNGVVNVKVQIRTETQLSKRRVDMIMYGVLVITSFISSKNIQETLNNTNILSLYKYIGFTYSFCEALCQGNTLCIQ